MGTCASGLICLDGVCKEPGTCADPVFPNSLCYSGDVSVSISVPAALSSSQNLFQRKVADCCTGSYCVQPTPSSDSFCMSFTIGEGLQCGDTEARVG